MDYRSNKILKELLAKGHVSVAYLSEIFDISERMVRKLLKELNDELKEKQVPQIISDSKGSIVFSSQEKNIEELVQKFVLENDFYTYRLMSNERKTISAMILLNSCDFRTAAELSEYLEISRNTIISDLNELKDWFLSNHMKLSSQVQKGYLIEGKEVDIRNGILKLLELNLDERDYHGRGISDAFQHLLLKELQYEERMEQIQEIVKEEEVRHDIYFSDYSFTEVMRELLILCKRFSMGKYLQEDVRESLIKSSKYPISVDILDRLGKLFDFQVPENEKRNYVLALRKKSYLKSSTKNVDELEIPILIAEVIYHISEAFHISFYLDFGLYDVLVDHMKSAIYRTRSGEVLHNPFGDEIEQKYPNIFNTVKKYVKPLEDYLRTEFQRDEISFLAMYFASMLEKKKAEKAKVEKVSVLLVGSMGRGTMRMLEAKLERFQDIIKIVGVKSSHEDFLEEDKDVDMIISALPYSHETIPVVQINSPMLTKHEVYQIYGMATEILEKKQMIDGTGEEVSEDVLLEEKKGKRSFLTSERIALDVEVDSWEDAVRVSGSLLYQTGIVKETYIEAMVDNVKMNGSYVVIYPGLAIPHAEAEKGVLKEGISMVRLKHPVYFVGKEEEPVFYIVGLSVTNANSINDMLYNLVKFFSNQSFLKKMNQVKSAEEMYRLLKNRI